MDPCDHVFSDLGFFRKESAEIGFCGIPGEVAYPDAVV